MSYKLIVCKKSVFSFQESVTRSSDFLKPVFLIHRI